jgi:hypothetical protein
MPRSDRRNTTTGVERVENKKISKLKSLLQKRIDIQKAEDKKIGDEIYKVPSIGKRLSCS